MKPSSLRPLRILAALALVVGTVAAGCSSDDKRSTKKRATSTTTREKVAPPAIVLNGQGNDLAAYETSPPYRKQIVVHHRDDAHPDGLDINGQICFDPKHPRRFIAGEDTNQRTTGEPGWGIFELSGDRVGDLKVRQLGKLVPTYQPSNDNPENYGCAFLDDGRILTTDVGNQATGDGDGQLIVWFGPFNSREVRYCKIDVTLSTGMGMLVRQENVLVAQARPPGSGIWRYDAREFPSSDTAEGGCDSKDATGAPMAGHVARQQFIAPGQKNSVATPNAIIQGNEGELYVSSVFNGVIAEFDVNGTYVRDILKPPAGEMLGAQPFSTGTPVGLGVGIDGSVFYADIGITITDTIGPGDGTGRVRRIAFQPDGTPLPPDTMDEGLQYPDGIGVYRPLPK